MVKVFRFLFSLDAPQDISGTVLFILALLEEVPWYGETEVNMFGFIVWACCLFSWGWRGLPIALTLAQSGFSDSRLRNIRCSS
jgi:hypothetical protein